MSYRTIVNKNSDYLRITISGEFDPADVTSSEAEIFAAISGETDRSRILLDVRGVTGTIGTVDRYLAAKRLATQLRPGVRFAIVGSQLQVTPDRFFETAARNRGLSVRSFLDTSEALTWLLVGQAAPEGR